MTETGLLLRESLRFKIHKNVYYCHIHEFSFKTVQNKNLQCSFKVVVGKLCPRSNYGPFSTFDWTARHDTKSCNPAPVASHAKTWVTVTTMEH